MGTKQKGKKTRTKKRKYTKRKSQKGGKKTGQFYTVIKDWKPEHEPPHMSDAWSHLEVDSKTQILFLTIGDRVELRSKKKKIDTCSFHGMKKVTEFEEIGLARRGERAGQFYDRLVPDCVFIGTKEWIKVKINGGRPGWILHKLLKTHLEKAGKSKRGLFSKLRRKTNDDLFYSAERGPRSRSRSRSRGDLFYSAERGPIDPTGALQPTFRKGIDPHKLGVDYSGALQPSRRTSSAIRPSWNWQPSMRPDLTLYGRK